MLGDFVCGSSALGGVADDTLNHLNSSIQRFGQRSIGFLNDVFDENAQTFGAFCARAFLENSCAALVGRLDPFRLMYLAEFQAQAGFEYGRSSNSAFRWTGDVLPDDKPPHEMWGPDHNLNKVSRALFSAYAEHVFWRPAVTSALDAIESDSSDLLDELRSLDPQTYVGYVRGRCASLYSTFSKGVHWDFFKSTIILDEETIKSSIRETVLILSGLSLVSHFIPTAYRSLSSGLAIESYKTIRGSFE